MLIKRKRKVKITIFYNHIDGYRAMATDGKLSVWNCYGTTDEAAREMAMFQLKKFQEEVASGIQPKGAKLNETKLPEGNSYPNKKRRFPRFF